MEVDRKALKRGKTKRSPLRINNAFSHNNLAFNASMARLKPSTATYANKIRERPPALDKN